MDQTRSSQLQGMLQRQSLDAAAVADATREIYQRLLRESTSLDGGNFTRFHPRDLQRMFDLYDQTFFGGGCRDALGEFPLTFAISKRMTRAAGKTTRRQHRQPFQGVVRREYEISVSGTLLFQTFCGEQRGVTVSGLLCHDRLQALQRVMEHEIIHLLEMLLWIDSSCTASRFQSIARRFFGHTQHTHELITPRERAWRDFGIRPGKRVRFHFEGCHLHGVVSRITKRATVLVEDPRGVRYTDGKHYKKFYVPVSLLQPVDANV